MDRNLVVFGSESSIAIDFIKRYGQNYNKIIGIDHVHNVYNRKRLNKYICLDMLDDGSFQKLNEFFCTEDIQITDVIFTFGINFTNSIFSVTLDEWDTTFKVNVRSIVFGMKSIYDKLYNHCSIVIIASQNGIVGHENRVDY